MKTRAKADEIAEQLKINRGNVAAVARVFGLSRSAIHKRILESPGLQKVLADSRESMLDNAESVLYKKALDGSTPELIFFLKTQGRKRGYVERQEFTGADGGPIEYRNATELSDEELANIAVRGSNRATAPENSEA